ncbi:MAG: methyltransferase [Verrucomicrobia bacterium]|nr:methyltransferase [Verrucomicrobiota bacterium]
MRDTYTIDTGTSPAGPKKPDEHAPLPETRSNWSERVHFLRAFIRKPCSVGALSPSSPALALAMVTGLGLHRAETVVELGPGTGAITAPILNRIGPKTTFFALEVDASYTQRLQLRFPKLSVYNDSAERVKKYLEVHNKQKACCIISGLPWASLDSGIQNRIMSSVIATLGTDGVFTTFAYLHARWMPQARKYRRNLESLFNRVDISPVVWGNLPPAFIYRCTSPRNT